MSTIDREAYAELVRAHHGKVIRLCQILLSNPTEAEDAAQDIFVKAYGALSKFRGDSSFSTWITRIAHNHCLDLLRRKTRQKTQPLDELPESKIPREEAPLSEETAEQMLSSLKPEYKEVLVLRELAGMKYVEIARDLRCSVDAVKARLRRAREELKMKGRHFLERSNV